MATQLTASAASGYMTDVTWVSVGNRRGLTGHYSSPSATTMYIQTGMPILYWYNVPDADPTTFTETTDGVGGINLYFSGFVTGATGYFFIIGS